jgi:hypothetical protein
LKFNCHLDFSVAISRCWLLSLPFQSKKPKASRFYRGFCLLFSGDLGCFCRNQWICEVQKGSKNRFMEYGSARNAALRAVLTARNAMVKGKNLQNHKKDTDINRQLSAS